jgi:hypothetical protein
MNSILPPPLDYSTFELHRFNLGCPNSNVEFNPIFGLNLGYYSYFPKTDRT